MTERAFNPYRALGVERDATDQAVDAAWARRLKRAQRGQESVSVEVLNRARAELKEPAQRVAWDLSHPAAPLSPEAFQPPAITLETLGMTQSSPVLGPEFDAIDEKLPSMAQIMSGFGGVGPILARAADFKQTLAEIMQVLPPLDPWEDVPLKEGNT